VADASRRPVRSSEGERREGIFITLEGGEGAGKSLQADALFQRLERHGVAVVLTREPGGTLLGERLRDVLLDVSSGGAEQPPAPLAETLLFVAARAELVAAVIAPALARGAAVICDRFADSTRAYQSFGRGIPLTVIDELNSVAMQGVRPDLTVFLDLPVAAGLARAGETGEADRFEGEEAAFHGRVRLGYKALAAREPERWLVVDSSHAPDAVADRIWERVEPLLRLT
jgi:dTMP kinase